MENADQEEDKLSFVPPYKGGYFRGKYISKEAIEDMFNWMPTSISEEDRKEIFGENDESGIGGV